MARGPILFMIFVALVSIGVFSVVSTHTQPLPNTSIHEVPQDSSSGNAAYIARRLSIQSFISLHITELSPVQEALGSHFYVTDVQANNGLGTVTYEDSNKQYIADFSYVPDDEQGYLIKTFKLRE